MISDEIKASCLRSWFTWNMKSRLCESLEAFTAILTWSFYCCWLAVANNIEGVAIIKTTVFLDLTPCCRVDIYRKIYSRERVAVVSRLLACARLTCDWNIETSHSGWFGKPFSGHRSPRSSENALESSRRMTHQQKYLSSSLKAHSWAHCSSD
jgi:hypothetical protein